VARRIIVAVIVTLAMLAAGRVMSMARSRNIVVDRAGMSIRHRTVTQQVGPGRPLIRVAVNPVEDVEVDVLAVGAHTGSIRVIPLRRISEDVFEGTLPDLGIGSRMRYAITVKAADGREVRLPEGADSFYLIKFKGRASAIVLVAHVAFMFASFFCMVLALFAAIRILRLGEGKRSAVRWSRWVLGLSLIGGLPLGWLLNYQTFGVLWEGYPFGRDITDNKTQLMFVLWLAILFLVRGSFLGRGEERDKLGARGFAWAVIASFIVSLGLFVLPHSM
jgi:hypothetical protein